MSEHTKESLEVFPGTCCLGAAGVQSGAGVAFCAMRARTDEQNAANARRLAACWNACQGISTEALEAGAMEDIREIVHLLYPAAPYLRHGIGEAIAPRVQALVYAAHAKLEGKPNG